MRDELALLSDVVGPRLQRLFRRLGSRLASLIMPAPMASFVPFSFYHDSRLHASKMEPPILFEKRDAPTWPSIEQGHACSD
ncbi:MAG: hypothetical protein WAV78_12750 [Xanthobacteraceae bacterium]